MRTIGTFELRREQRAQWHALELQQDWAKRYPELFDADDTRLATGKQGREGYHHSEWLAAIILHHLTGYRALVGKYQFHRAKKEIVRSLGLGTALLSKHAEFRNTQGPDLLMFAPDLSDYFLCEVKGPNDELTPLQEQYFQFLEEATGRQIQLMRFRWAPKTPKP